MAEQPTALCIVNTKVAARNIFQLLRQAGFDDALHLSTAMCPAHRLAVIDEVRDRLAHGRPCRLVSTQLVEAGVDIDFPILFRELAPLESVIQAAGRCNREGLLNRPDGSPGGRAVVFRSVEQGCPPDLWYRAGIHTLADLLAVGQAPDIGKPEDVQLYFERLYASGNLDKHNIQVHRENWRFCQVASLYRLIEDETIPVVVATWRPNQDEIQVLLDAVMNRSGRLAVQRLGRFQVNMRRDEFDAGIGLIEDAGPVSVWRGNYDELIGITPAALPSALIV